ncbi:MAG: hypothetical protein E7056_09840 [Lentisphaerae bacterium]|nr:hypothetical protein [Lentisphaerota bacterium]
MVELQKIQFEGFKDALQLSNGIVRLVVSVDAGPRILFYGFEDGQNFFHIFDEPKAPCDDGEWHSYGGHRLWYAPETVERTYYPDNKPVEWKFENGVLTLLCPDETSRSLGKRIAITLDEKTSEVKVEHTLKNIGLWPIEVSIWCLSVMERGGTLKIAAPKFIPHGGGAGQTFEPARSIVIWPFTPMGDPRLEWGSEFISMRQDDAYKSKLKFGMLNELGYALYELNGEVFRKDFPCLANAVYPDMNCNCEFYTEPGFLEIESLSPVTRLEPQCEATHTEYWSLSR